MPISSQHKQAFIHIPKCGGTSIEVRYNLQSKNCFFEGKYDAYTFDGVTYAPQHLTPTLLSQLVEDWPTYNTFCFVRDPFAKAVSEYFQLHTHYYKKPKRFFFEPSFRRWIRNDVSKFRMDHTLPQWKYAKDCQHVFSMKDMNSAINVIDMWFKHPRDKKLEHKKKSGQHWAVLKKKTNKQITENLSARTKKLIYKVYEIDFDNLADKF